LQVYGSQIAKRECSAVLHPSEYDVYHSSYFPLSDFKEFPNIPRVFTVYDLIPVLFPEFVVATVYQRTIDMLRSIDIKKDWIICISEQTKQDFCRYTGMNADRVFVTPLAAANHFMPVQNISYIRSVLEKCKIPNSPYILSLCTLEPRKNIIVLIRAFADLIQTHPEIDLNLVLVGINGWKNHEIFKTVQNTPLVKGRLFFTGYLSDDDLAPIYSGALAFVYPSLYEGFGLPPLEAMQCGTPIITSNNSSLPEVVADAGILINPQHQDELSHALWKLVNDTDLRSQLSQKSLLRSRQFSWSKCVDEIIEVYRTAVDNRD
jgi:glycosyltransferase involved in cell wall biosynthesis